MKNKIEIYQTKDKQTELSVKFENETVWLSQAQLTKLFSQSKQNISLHINNCFREGKLKKKSVVKESLTTVKDGEKYKIIFNNQCSSLLYVFY